MFLLVSWIGRIDVDDVGMAMVVVMLMKILVVVMMDCFVGCLSLLAMKMQ